MHSTFKLIKNVNRCRHLCHDCCVKATMTTIVTAVATTEVAGLVVDLVALIAMDTAAGTGLDQERVAVVVVDMVEADLEELTPCT